MAANRRFIKTRGEFHGHRCSREFLRKPESDPQRGPSSARHKPWSSGGAAPTHFEWVALSRSLQWSAFQRTLHLLRERGNSVLVMLGPFNEHMIADGQRAEYRALRDGAAAELSRDDGFLVAPDTLPSELYADASHPLTSGYSKLAAQLFANERFRRWAEESDGGLS